ncbi:MAG: hypothetical protein QM741_05565 [Rudaea sp.]|uniref:hypothetical protein n=1 Tax=Rudaea sp. TaxID=2136325 RepID=UPI0039E58C0E
MIGIDQGSNRPIAWRRAFAQPFHKLGLMRFVDFAEPRDVGAIRFRRSGRSIVACGERRRGKPGRDQRRQNEQTLAHALPASIRIRGR